MSHKIINLDVIDTVKKIKQREISIEKVVKTYINHLKHVNPKLNAFVEDRFTEATIEAQHKDKHFPTDLTKYPLYGIPMTIKESFDVSGMKTTGGLIHLKGNLAKNDAPIVQKLKKAGAIILGKTNTATLCYAQESVNKLYGRTNNPWDLNRTAGGSTGGEGAILAVGGAVAGIGSDIGGSIRLPSHFNGVFGFKSGKHTITSDGHFPAAKHPLQQRMESYGPMGKSTRDMKLLYEVITDQQLPNENLTNITINVLPTTVDLPLNEQTQQWLDKVANVLSGKFSIKRDLPPHFYESAVMWQEIMSIDGSQNIATLAFNQSPSTFHVLKSYFQEKISKNTNYHSYLLWAILGSKLFKPNTKRIKEIEKIFNEVDAHLEEALNDEILIFPVYHSSAKHHGEVFSEIFSIKKTFKKYMPFLAYANVWGLPSLTIPLSQRGSDLPIALQIISRVGNEAKIFSLGELLEKHFTTYIRCDLHDAKVSE